MMKMKTDSPLFDIKLEIQNVLILAGSHLIRSVWLFFVMSTCWILGIMLVSDPLSMIDPEHINRISVTYTQILGILFLLAGFYPGLLMIKGWIDTVDRYFFRAIRQNPQE